LELLIDLFDQLFADVALVEEDSLCLLANELFIGLGQRSVGEMALVEPGAAS
jgi:hypothetical protein